MREQARGAQELGRLTLVSVADVHAARVPRGTQKIHGGTEIADPVGARIAKHVVAGYQHNGLSQKPPYIGKRGGNKGERIRAKGYDHGVGSGRSIPHSMRKRRKMREGQIFT